LKSCIEKKARKPDSVSILIIPNKLYSRGSSEGGRYFTALRYS